MKRLWTKIPPCMSDILGLQALINNTSGVAIVDDASSYKPLRYTQGGVGRPENRRGPGGKHNGYFGSQRVVSSEIREANVVTGTAGQVWAAVETGIEVFRPDFMLLATAPCAAMIGSDLAEAADRVQAERRIPAAAVNLDGQKDYLFGVGMAMEAMGKLLLEKGDTRPGTVNLLGCNTVDWSEEMVQETGQWLASHGWQVLSRWGSRETTENLKNAGAAARNLVVNLSGLRLARYMEAELGIPYVVGAPFGADQCAQLLEELETGLSDPKEEQPEGEPEALVIGEQLAANAIRQGLEQRGFAHVRVCSFLEMDKGLMSPGDKKLVSEDELEAELSNETLRVVLGDVDCRIGSPVKWAPLPNQGNLAPSRLLAPFSMTDGALDRWLDGVL